MSGTLPQRLARSLISLAVLATASEAGAFCIKPQAPSAPWPPSTPFCSADATGSYRCSESQLDAYNRAIESYIDDLQRYADEAERYTDQATRYADCEATQAMRDWDAFAKQ